MAPRNYHGRMPYPDLTIAQLLECYRGGRATPRDVFTRLLESAADDHHVWITRLSHDQVMAQVSALDPGAAERLPLYGVPFVIKDNIDLAGVPTTAGCPGFAYTPSHSAAVVRKLMAAGAIALGKTNLDQFATGLVGTRSPYGACRNSIDAGYISGGSSSGSAVAVALGLASFALGTDTAGSGRVPAAFNNIIGLKPSNGRLSTQGVVPACRSIDCVSIFALTAADAARVLDVAQGFDADDVYSRPPEDRPLCGLRFGVPRPEQLEFFGDGDYQRLFEAAVRRLEALGGSARVIDFEPFLATARLLYEGPWVAERFAAVGAYIGANPGTVHPVTRRIIEAGGGFSAAAAFEGLYRLRALRRLTEPVWSNLDLIVTPTAATIYRIAEVIADPLQLNSNLGFYTNYMNLLDLCGVAVPAGFRGDGLPFGITLVGPRGADRALLDVAGRLHPALVATLGATGQPVPAPPPAAAAARASAAASAVPGPAAPPTPAAAQSTRDGKVLVAVCGAHMQGLALNHQLRERGGYLVQSTRTAPRYRLFALPGGPPHRPGLLRVTEGGAAIEIETWLLPTDEVGSLLAGIPQPLGLGQVELDSGGWVTGFLCEGYATAAAADITAYGGWRAYLRDALR
jgi:allophanate hydrolase